MKASDNPFVRVIHSLRTGNPSTPSDSSWNVYAKADGIYAQSSNAVVGPFGAGTAMSLGSNAMAVGATNQAGTTGTYIGSDHRHLGLHSITSSSSNTLDRPTVNFRAGAGVGLTATDSDGNGVFDTITITSSGAGGGGGFSETIVGVAASTSAFTTSSTSFTDLTGMSVTGTTGARRCRVTFTGNVSNDTVGAWTAVTLLIDGSNVQGGSDAFLAVGTSRGANDIGNVCFDYLTDVLSAASHTFKIQMKVSSGTGKIRDTGTYRLRVSESPMTT